MRLTLAWAWGGLLLVSCAGPTEAADVALERGTSDAKLCASDEARRALNDDTGDGILRAHQAHVPDEREMKLVAAWWILLLASAETGALDPALLLPEFGEEVSAIAARYSSSFDACAGSVEALSTLRQPLISSEQSFTCEGNCIPSAQVLSESLGRILTSALERAQGSVFSLIPSVSAIGEGLLSARGLGKSVADAVDQALTRGEAEVTLRSVAELVASAGAIAAAATLVVTTGPVVTEIAAIGSAVALLLEADKISTELIRAYELVNACRAFKQRECMTCTCSEELLEYAGGTVTSTCLEWSAVGRAAFCQSLRTGTNQCCTCTDAALLAFSNCTRRLSFNADATALEYENCCGEAGGLLNAKSTPPPQCPCNLELP